MESNVFRDAQQADLVSNENADTKYGQDQAETHLVKLVDGKLVHTADVADEVTDDDLRNRYANDEERALNSPNQRTYDLVDATQTHTPTDDMIPATPSTPDPSNPVPAAPETPTPPAPVPPGPEIPDLPTTPKPDNPEITDPTEPGRSHEINNIDDPEDQIGNMKHTQDTPTSGVSGTMPGVDVPTQSQDPAAHEELPEFLGTNHKSDANSAAVTDTKPKDDEGMGENPDTGSSARPYDVDAKDEEPYQPKERPQETAQMMDQPKEAMDESAAKKEPMLENSTASSPSDLKSTDNLDVKYNDQDAARKDVI